MARPLLAPLAPVLGGIESRIQALLSPWVNPLDAIDVGLDDEDQLD